MRVRVEKEVLASDSFNSIFFINISLIASAFLNQWEGGERRQEKLERKRIRQTETTEKQSQKDKKQNEGFLEHQENFYKTSYTYFPCFPHFPSQLLTQLILRNNLRTPIITFSPLHHFEEQFSHTKTLTHQSNNLHTPNTLPSIKQSSHTKTLPHQSNNFQTLSHQSILRNTARNNSSPLFTSINHC